MNQRYKKNINPNHIPITGYYGFLAKLEKACIKSKFHQKHIKELKINVETFIGMQGLPKLAIVNYARFHEQRRPRCQVCSNPSYGLYCKPCIKADNHHAKFARIYNYYLTKDACIAAFTGQVTGERYAELQELFETADEYFGAGGFDELKFESGQYKRNHPKFGQICVRVHIW